MSNVFDSLPDEIIALILSVSSLTCRDLCCFAQCCGRFNFLAKDEKLWKRKATERWNIWSDRFQATENLFWLNLYQKRHQLEIFVKKQLYKLGEKSLLKSMVSEEDLDFVNLSLNMFQEDSYLHLNDVLQSILQGTECSKDLTQKYYAKKALVSLSRLICKTDLYAYLENPGRLEQLEEGATLIARWMCPLANISFKDIEDKLDDITRIVRTKLDIKEGQYLTNESDKSFQLKAINALKDVFYNQLKFRGNRENYYNLGNSYINEVLKTRLGIPITLSIIFQSIAKRIGLTIQPVNCPGHFLVRWKYFDSSLNEIKYCHIDCFNGGVFLDQRQLPHSLLPGPVPPPKEILKRMVLNIIHILKTEMERTQLHESIVNLSHALDLLMILAPDHGDMTRMNLRIKQYLGVQLDEGIKLMEELLTRQSVQNAEDKRLLQLAKKQQQSFTERRKTPKQKLRSDSRNTNVAFKVGTVMRHHRFDYRCVVYGWDHKCKMTEEWIIQMGVDNLSGGRHQPFYNVLVSDRTERYAAQENLCPEPQVQMITHPEVGRYFKEFTGDRYIPNDHLQNVYPEDF